jgi:hypothetical protein
MLSETTLEVVLDQLYATTLKALLDIGLATNSDIVKSVTVTPNNNGIEILTENYAIYIDSGRRPLARRVPFNVILAWVKDRGISFTGKSDREVAYMIQTSIYRKGIRPRKFISTLQKDIERLTGETIEEAILEDITKNYEQLFKTVV